MSQTSEFKEKLVAINRITKVVKGGRRFGFAALVVTGNQNQHPTADGNWGEREGRSRRAKALLRVDDKK